MRSAFLLSALALAFGVSAQSDNSLVGTWSSGSGAVQTGGDFCSPAEMTFTYPNNTGISYSFTDDGFFEEAQYRYDSNATNPKCIRGKIIWQHGKYEVQSDGSIVLTPFHSDGRIQVQDPCAAQTNVVTYYDVTVTFKAYSFSIDPHTGREMLNLNAFDGSKLAPMYISARPPNMLPTQTLTGTNETGQQISKRDSEPQIQKRSAAVLGAGPMGVVGVLAVSVIALSVLF